MENQNLVILDEAVDKLSAGLLMLYQPELVKLRNQLNEIVNKQRKLIDLTHNENLKFSEIQASDEINVMMNKLKIYHTKLLNMKKQMALLHEKSTKLKKQAIKIQQFKEKELLQKEMSQEPKLNQDLVATNNTQ